MTNTNLLARVRAHLISTKLIQPGDKILAAVSGGLDSAALLHLLAHLQRDLKFNLEIVHVHHGLRGAEADRDLEFTRQLAAELKLPFHFRKVNVRDYARRRKMSLEESARVLRYQAFDEVLAETKAAKLATAHTADDQAETVLDHLLRGSGLAGLRGMRARRDVYIRPLLKFTRQQVEEFVREHQISFREDSSNRDRSFKRNRLRHELLPYLKERFNPQITAALTRSAQILEENEAFLNHVAESAYKSVVSVERKNEIVLEIKAFLSYFSIVQKYVLFHAGEKLGVPRSQWNFQKLARVLQALSAPKLGKKIIINKDFEIYIDRDGLAIRRRALPALKLKVNLQKQKSAAFGDFEIRWQIENKAAGVRLKQRKKVAVVDFDKTGAVVYFRTGLPGDRFIPLNFTGHKKLASFFSDKKTPHHLRRQTPILESPAGIVWIAGFGIDDRFKVTHQTKRLLKLEIIDRTHAT
jgi:tRNA(Ile)-lysidine synthase